MCDSATLVPVVVALVSSALVVRPCVLANVRCRPSRHVLTLSNSPAMLSREVITCVTLRGALCIILTTWLLGVPDRSIIAVVLPLTGRLGVSRHCLLLVSGSSNILPTVRGLPRVCITVLDSV